MLEGPPATNPWRGAPWQDLTIDKNTLECDNTDLRQQIRELTAENKVLCRRLKHDAYTIPSPVAVHIMCTYADAHVVAHGRLARTQSSDCIPQRGWQRRGKRQGAEA